MNGTTDNSQVLTDLVIPVVQPTDAIRNVEKRLDAIEREIRRLADPDMMNLVVFDGNLDKLLAAFVIATGSAASGMQVHMFFTFWATAALRRTRTGTCTAKTIIEKAFCRLLPRGPQAARLSRLDMLGIGRWLMKREMCRKNIASLEQLIEVAAELDVHITVCEMSMRLMGIHRDELIDYPNIKFAGVASLAELSGKANTTLFL